MYIKQCLTQISSGFWNSPLVDDAQKTCLIILHISQCMGHFKTIHL